LPGFTGHSQVPEMFAAAGMRYPELLDPLVSDALTGQRRL
jgi:D-alanine-D-alanine ligase